MVTYVSTAAQSDDQQQQWPEATHQRRGGEALSPAATASSSPHARPCRSRRGERTDLQKGEEERCPGLFTSPSSSLFSPSSPPRVRRGIKTQLLRGTQGGGSGELGTGGKESTSQSDDTFTFPRYTIREPRDFFFYVRSLRDRTSVLYALS